MVNENGAYDLRNLTSAAGDRAVQPTDSQLEQLRSELVEQRLELAESLDARTVKSPLLSLLKKRQEGGQTFNDYQEALTKVLERQIDVNRQAGRQTDNEALTEMIAKEWRKFGGAVKDVGKHNPSDSQKEKRRRVGAALFGGAALGIATHFTHLGAAEAVAVGATATGVGVATKLRPDKYQLDDSFTFVSAVDEHAGVGQIQDDTTKLMDDFGLRDGCDLANKVTPAVRRWLRRNKPGVKGKLKEKLGETPSGATYEAVKRLKNNLDNLNSDSTDGIDGLRVDFAVDAMFGQLASMQEQHLQDKRRSRLALRVGVLATGVVVAAGALGINSWAHQENDKRQQYEQTIVDGNQQNTGDQNNKVDRNNNDRVPEAPDKYKDFEDMLPPVPTSTN